MKALVEKLRAEHILSREEFAALLEHHRDEELARFLFANADEVRRQTYGTDVYIRGLVEFTNYCKNNCYYCGLRAANRACQRYRLSKAQILDCCREGWRLGFRTFVLQGGEDPWYTPERIEELVRAIKGEFPECALTLSVGEQPREVYQQWFDAGADRFLLRHETATPAHYAHLHPAGLSLENRLRCLRDLKEIGYQVGCGIMVGSPGQTTECLVNDLLFMAEFQPDMVGIGPFIPQHNTPFRGEAAGTLELTLFLLGLVRLMLPRVLLPATTALGTIHPRGREKGILAGANVCMPNLSPADVREKYTLYDNKLCTGEEAAQSLNELKKRMEAIGYQIVESRGDRAGILPRQTPGRTNQ